MRATFADAGAPPADQPHRPLRIVDRRVGAAAQWSKASR